MAGKQGHWEFSETLDYEKASGFVYMIIDLDTGMKYIGKKNFRGRGVSNRGQQSNWRSYHSSSKYLQSLVKEGPATRFKYVVLDQYYTAGGLSFAEVWCQVTSETPSQNEEYHNRFIDKITWKVTEPVTTRTKRRLKYYNTKYRVN